MRLTQKALLSYTKRKVALWFRVHPLPAHGLPHAERVMKWATYIARREHRATFVVALAALVHDIGRAREKSFLKKSHHELSYELCQEWFRKDAHFAVLTTAEKREILYAVRYHGNDEATKYVSAVILRDADKIDCLGTVGLQRSIAYCQWAQARHDLVTDVRLRYHIIYFLKTKTARLILKKTQLLRPFEVYLRKLNKKNIKPITL